MQFGAADSAQDTDCVQTPDHIHCSIVHSVVMPATQQSFLMLNVQASSGSGEEAEDEGDSDEGNDDEEEEEGPPAKKAKVCCLPHSHQEANRTNKIMTTGTMSIHMKACLQCWLQNSALTCLQQLQLSQVPTLHDCC